MRHGSSGITTIEVLIAVAIVAVSMTYAIPEYFRYIEDNRLRHAVEDLHSKLHWARSVAIKDNQDISFVVQAGSNWCVGFTSAASCNCQTAASCNLGRIVGSEYPSTSLSQAGVGSSNFFEPNRGVINNNGGTLSVSAGGRTVAVAINRMGFSRICSSDMSGYRAC